jgi:hypothetical protein
MMSSAPDDGAPAPQGFWQSLKSLVMRQLSGITIVGVLGLLTTLIVAYFQNMSAYQDKVTTQAKDDMTSATQVFAEASTALSSAISLQQQLINYFYAAVPNGVYKDDGAYPTASARAMYKDYMDTYTSLHQNYNLLARKAEIYLDWPVICPTTQPRTPARMSIRSTCRRSENSISTAKNTCRILLRTRCEFPLPTNMTEPRPRSIGTARSIMC